MKIIPLAIAAAAAAVVFGKKKKKRNGNGAATWKERQNALAMMGYYKGPIDGRGDTPAMRGTVLAFQMSNLVRPTGKWDRATQAALGEALSRYAAGVSTAGGVVRATEGGEQLTFSRDAFDRVIKVSVAKRYASGKLMSSIGTPAAYGEFMSTTWGMLDGSPILLKNLPETEAVQAFNTDVFDKIDTLRNFALEVEAKKAAVGMAETESWFASVAPNIPIIGPMWGGIGAAWAEFFGKE